jgi:2-polyprenyl-3-methyl-5-hydroxy-6-metoxy-1,4-benzoquinol methylase
MPQTDGTFQRRVAWARRHLDGMRIHLRRPFSSGAFLEFGAGQDLTGPLAFWALGVERQWLLDIEELMRPSLVNDTIRRFQRLSPFLRLSRLPEREISSANRGALNDLERIYGIEYRAPVDARKTGLATASVDCVTSTDVLEHLPPEDIEAILRECRRVLSEGGLLSVRIDYQDHYAYADPDITVYNFLQYSAEDWRRYNSSLQYQNRLRHRDYLEMFARTPLDLLGQETEGGANGISGVRIDRAYRKYTTTELAVRNAFVALRR